MIEEDRTLLAFFLKPPTDLGVEFIIHEYCRALQIKKKNPLNIFFILCIFQGRVAFFVIKTF